MWKPPMAPVMAVGKVKGDGEPDGGGETVSNPPAAVRFIVIGDSGSGSAGQYAVGQAIADVCDG